jgi:hypothetical protein
MNTRPLYHRKSRKPKPSPDQMCERLCTLPPCPVHHLVGLGRMQHGAPAFHRPHLSQVACEAGRTRIPRTDRSAIRVARDAGRPWFQITNAIPLLLTVCSARCAASHGSTSYAERGNLSIRMACRRFTRLTNAFSKKLENHIAAVALYVAFYNFCRPHETLTPNAKHQTTPAIALGLTDHIWSWRANRCRTRCSASEAHANRARSSAAIPRNSRRPRLSLLVEFPSRYNHRANADIFGAVIGGC